MTIREIGKPLSFPFCLLPYPFRPSFFSSLLTLLGCELAAWLLLVPSTVTLSTFLLLNALTISMFGVGVASAAKGLPTHSVAQLLHEVEQDTPTRRHVAR